MRLRRSALFASILCAAAFGCRRSDVDDTRRETTTPTSPAYDTTRTTAETDTTNYNAVASSSILPDLWTLAHLGADNAQVHVENAQAIEPSNGTTGQMGTTGTTGTTDTTVDQGTVQETDQGAVGGVSGLTSADRAARTGTTVQRNRSLNQQTGPDENQMQQQAPGTTTTPTGNQIPSQTPTQTPTQNPNQIPNQNPNQNPNDQNLPNQPQTPDQNGQGAGTTSGAPGTDTQGTSGQGTTGMGTTDQGQGTQGTSDTTGTQGTQGSTSGTTGTTQSGSNDTTGSTVPNQLGSGYTGAPSNP